MRKLIKYIKQVFGLALNLNDIPGNELKGLPYFIKEAYKFRLGKLLERNIVFIELKGTKTFTPQQFKKQIEIIENKLNYPVVLLLPQIENYNRNRLIQRKINFIIPGKQIFIPDLVVDLKEYVQPVKTQTEYLQPAAQCLLLYHFQKEKLHDKDYRELSQILNYTYRTIARAVENLLGLNLCGVTDTKVKQLQFVLPPKDLWENALPYLINPVKKVGYVNEVLPGEFLLKTNITALAHFTMISEDKKMYYAIYKDHFTQLKKQNKIETFSDYDGDYVLEVWKYDPKVPARDKFVDPLSLYMIFKDSEDERIQMECDKMLNEITW